ncbi:MAG TPA: FxDxF family PEP-CTERM protein [Burkholderiaceae bacterium]|nr:FxDxF family PEP-CTERM protein [Burkholderiaceae bacterium]HMY98482.1 FxDxF family PEP-CTERM protein [Burkholderiaceae bacterium]HNB44674.1 FxDxF family PEP-CTERM protein [Burkholderiaceae bacterium]HNG78097.1 FxDxF family PEP-CTERM protein [Burkholderiaceae bacterium]
MVALAKGANNVNDAAFQPCRQGAAQSLQLNGQELEVKAIRNLSFVAVALAGAVAAQAATFQNGGFESGAFVDSNNLWSGHYFTGSLTLYNGAPLGDYTGDKTMALFAGDAALTGWTVAVPGAMAWIDASNPWNMQPASGAKFLDLTGWSSAWSATQPYGEYAAFRSVVSQTFTTVVGQKYAVAFDIGYDAVESKSSNSGVAASDVDVGVNGVYGTYSSAVDGWATRGFTFTANSTSTTLSFKTSNLESEYVGLDNVSVTAVPEPETYAMMLAGLGALGFVARRRRLR